MLARIRQANPHIEILPTSDPSFARYAMPVEAGPLQDLFSLLASETEIPDTGNVYVASVPTLEAGEGCRNLQQGFYGGMPIQIGYCNGHSKMLGALEYHRGCEVTLAATPFVLLLAQFADIRGGRLDSRLVQAYYVSEGECFALLESTLHFAPCAVTRAGFKAGIVLPRETNTLLSPGREPVFWQDKLLFARNKWMIAHPDSIQARERGAYTGIDGENIQIHTVD